MLIGKLIGMGPWEKHIINSSSIGKACRQVRLSVDGKFVYVGYRKLKTNAGVIGMTKWSWKNVYITTVHSYSRKVYSTIEVYDDELEADNALDRYVEYIESVFGGEVSED